MATDVKKKIETYVWSETFVVKTYRQSLEICFKMKGWYPLNKSGSQSCLGYNFHIEYKKVKVNKLADALF